MLSGTRTGYCDSNCSHPSCWIYYRNILKDQLCSFNNMHRKPLSIVVPHQSVCNIDLNILPTSQRSPKISMSPRDIKSDEIPDYLPSRNKMSIPKIHHVTPFVENSALVKESNNLKNLSNKVSLLDVHEIFDMEELQSDWKQTFKSKDVYVWVSNEKGRRNQIKKETNNGARIIKTPVMQLAPVLEDRVSQDRKKSSLSAASDILNHYSNSNTQVKKTHKKVSKRKSEKSAQNSNRHEIHKENILQKSLESTFVPQKMLIHNISDRGLNKFISSPSSQIYILDPVHSDSNIEKYFFLEKPMQSKSFESLESGISIKKMQNQNQTQKEKYVSIIESKFALDGLCFTLAPQNTNNLYSPIVSSRTNQSDSRLSADTNSSYDSLMRNAPSDRSTLNDENLLPGGYLFKNIQTSFPPISGNRDVVPDSESMTLDLVVSNELTQNTSTLMRSTRSAPDNNMQLVPNPPPPSPETSTRLRSTSADANLNRT